MEPETSGPGLLKLPPELMKKIIEDFDFQEIFTLRKVCRPLRQFIDSSANFDIKMKELKFIVKEGVATIKILKNQSRIKIIYTKTPQGCWMMSQISGYIYHYWNDDDIQVFLPVYRKYVLLKGRNFLEICLKDVELFLKFQKSKMNNVSIHIGDNGYFGLEEKMISILRNRHSRLEVNSVCIGTHTGERDFDILLSIESNPIRYLSIWNAEYQDLRLLITLTPHWRNAETLKFNGFTLPVMQHLGNLKKVWAFCKKISAEDIVAMRKIFLQLQTLQSLELSISEGVLPGMEKQFGRHYGWHQVGSHKQWHYSTGRVGEVFEIERTDRRITFHYQQREPQLIFPIVQEPDFL